jgi:hypothetical protein
MCETICELSYLKTGVLSIGVVTHTALSPVTTLALVKTPESAVAKHQVL